ncbi:MAG: hypothetical protein HQK84_00170 [Nitrospinae bacterium]|nr:hypothetical protein [Nitrospinota bacterium]
MKVDNNGTVQGTGGINKNQNANKPGNINFSDFLDRAAEVGQTQLTPQTGGVSQIPNLSPLSPLFKLQTDSSSSIRESGMNQLDNLLTSLEMYVNALKNNQVDKERLKPLLDELIMKKDELSATVSKLPENDELRTLVNGALYSVTQEAINFQSYN